MSGPVDLATSGEPVLLAFRDVAKTFPDGTRALDGVSFVVPRGQFCVLLGPSGSGKSTLLRCVNGLVAPDAGTIEVVGRRSSPRTLPEIRRRVAMVHQHFNLVERAPVGINVLTGAIAQVPAWRALLHWFPEPLRNKAVALVLRVGLEPRHLHRRVGELSGGQQQRVGIARAFLCDPDLLLADEPVASLDPSTAQDILSLLREAARERSATVLCSLHQPELAVRFADRILGLRAGRIVFDGPPERLDDAALARIYGHGFPNEHLELAA